MKKTIFTFVLLCSYFLSYDCTLKILSPQELKDKFSNIEIETSLAYFGYIPWGKTIIGTVYLANPIDGCRPLNGEYNSSTFPIIFLEKNNCNLATKIINAQMSGAKLVLINDDQYGETSKKIIGDDGGKNINVPVVLIKKRDGDMIKECVEKKTVTLSLSFNMPNLEKVKLEIWLSSSDEKSYKFVNDLYPNFQKLKDFIDFTPLYAMWYCTYCKYNHYNVVNENCLSGGRYCYPDPDSNGPLEGRTFVKESLRQICLFQENKEKWWNYASDYSNKCLKKSQEKCVEQIFESLKINQENINNCMKNSFNGQNENLDDNQILKKDHELFKNNGIQAWPSVVINNVFYRGNLEPDLILEAICRGFSTPPKLCEKIIQFSPSNDDPQKKTIIINDNNSDVSSSEEKDDLFLILSVSAIFVLAILCFFLILRNKFFSHIELSRDMSLNISTVVTNYFAFQDKADKQKILDSA